MNNITLNNGIKMPIIGSGTNTFGKVANEFKGELRGDTAEVDMAVENGYRHFDTAQAYNNEEVLGKGLEDSGLPREEFFITTKLNTFAGFHGLDWVKSGIEKSLKKLKTDYIDLFLIHAPWDNSIEMVETWSLLEDYYKDGIFKSIGVSSFKEEHLDLILENCKVKPAVNQIESHVVRWNDKLIAYNQDNGIDIVAWSPVKGVTDSSREVLERIGNKYGKTYTQVILRYQIERNVVVIPKSHNKNHQAQNLDIFDFKLSDQDREQIADLG